MRAVPTNTPRNSGFSTTTLMDCIAAIPAAGAMRPSAFITKVEKAKKAPPTRPEPSAERKVSAKIRRAMARLSI